MNQRVFFSITLSFGLVFLFLGALAAISLPARDARAAVIDPPKAFPEPAAYIPPPESHNNHAPASQISQYLPYTITYIGTPAMIGVAGLGINDAGDVVGSGYIPDVGTHGFLWHNGVMTDVGTLVDGKWSYAYGVNNLGQVVGESETTHVPNVYYRHAFLWQNGQIAFAGSFGSDSMAYRINDAGQFVGDAYSFELGLWRGFISGPGGMRDLGSLFGGWTNVHGLNQLGHVVGDSIQPGGTQHAFLWKNGSMVDLLPDFYASEAIDINNEAQVVGTAWFPPDNHASAFLYQAGKPIIDIGVLPGYKFSRGKAVNDSGQVVGISATSGNTEWAPFLWTDENKNGISDPYEILDLNWLLPPDTGWELEYVADINNRGQMVGWGYFNGLQRAFLLSPVPTWTLMFYLDGDNNLGSTYPPIIDQLENGKWSPHINIIALHDNTGNGDSAYIEIQHTTHSTQTTNYDPYREGVNVWPKGELPMNDSLTLSNFIVWTQVNYPTDHYALILSDHGSGLGGGLCDSGGCMSLKEMQQALKAAFDTTGKKIEVLYMDMCLMGMIEDAYQFRGYTDYYVSSENLQYVVYEPYFDYVSEMRAGTTPRNVADQFAKSYNRHLIKDKTVPYTIASADMAALDDLVAGTNLLGISLNAHMATITPTLTTIASQVQRYDNELPEGINQQDTYIDLYDFAKLAKAQLAGYPDIVAAADQVMLAVDSYIMFEGHAISPTLDLSYSHGVSVFFPATKSSFYNAANYAFAVGGWSGSAPLDLSAQAGSWAQMLVHYFEAAQPGGMDDPTPPEPIARQIIPRKVYLSILLR